MVLQLRPYQRELKSNLYRAWKQYRAVMAALATGGGKTIVFSSIAKDCVDRGGRVLVLAHREELITQAANKLMNLGLEVGIIKSGYKPEFYKKVQVASIQTIVRREIPYKFNLLIVDEAHHDQADNSYGKVRKRLLELNPDMFTLGVTATPIRLNGSGFKDIYETLIPGISVKELIKLGYLAPPKYLTFPFVDMGKIKKTGGDFNLKELSEEYQKRIPAEYLVQDYLKHAKGLQTIAFAIDVNHSKEILRAYQAAGIKAAHIDGKTPDESRKFIINAFAKKDIQVVTNVGVFTEGYDCPGIECVQLARPTDSLSLYMQMGGRGLRTADGKANCIVLDRSNCVVTHGLLESDREWELGGNSGKKKKTEVMAIDKQTGQQFRLIDMPSTINPEYIELRELVKDDNFERASLIAGATNIINKFKSQALVQGRKNKWVWFRAINWAKNEKQARAICDIYCETFNHKPGLAHFLMKEYYDMKLGKN